MDNNEILKRVTENNARGMLEYNGEIDLDMLSWMFQ